MSFAHGAPSDKRGAYNTYLVINSDLFLAANSYIYPLHGISIWLSHWHFESYVSKTEYLSCIPQQNLLPFPCPHLKKTTTTATPNASVMQTSSQPLLSMNHKYVKTTFAIIPIPITFPHCYTSRVPSYHFSPAFYKGSYKGPWLWTGHSFSVQAPEWSSLSVSVITPLFLLTILCSQDKDQAPRYDYLWTLQSSGTAKSLCTTHPFLPSPITCPIHIRAFLWGLPTA